MTGTDLWSSIRRSSYMNLSLRSRLLAAFLVAIIGLLVIAGMSFSTISMLNKRLDHVYEDDFRPYQEASKASFAFMQWLRALDNLLDVQDEAEVRRYELLIRRHAGTTEEALEDLGGRTLQPEGKELLSRAIDNLQVAGALQDRIINLAREGRRENARNLWTAELQPVIDNVETVLAEYLAIQERQFREVLAESDRNFVGALMRIGVVALIVLLVSVLTTIFVQRLVGRAVGKLRTSTQELSASTSEIVATTSQLAANAVETGTGVNQITATVEETRQTARVANEKARFVAESAQKVSQVSGNGGQIVERTIDTMNA
ncbi:MAG: hypothetical protein GF344_18485, partial [Chitinivibrionales bacterium]|nr:hypothetical protein [Chitinivibrionales bacterium]